MNNTYPISTLQDIYNLPTIEAIKTCLAEITEGMIQARVANDVALEAIKGLGADDIKQVLAWPPVTNWTDDGRGEINLKINLQVP